MNLRIKKLRSLLKENNLNGLIVSSPANITYLTEYNSRDSYFLVSSKHSIYFTDSRYTQEAGIGLKGIAEVKEINGSFFKLLADACCALGLKRMGFEAKNIAFSLYNKIRGSLGEEIDLIPAHNLVERLRQVKTEAELAEIKKAVRITGLALKYIKKFISAGKKEIEVAAELERFIRYNGATGSSFEIIVAAGPNSSYPHHQTSQKRIKNNEPVLIDIGVDYHGYKSDLTRVFFLGKINSLYRKIYDIVLEAQVKAIKEVKQGADVRKIDAAARQFIAQKGYGGFFGHALGHGVGLEVHEEPRISSKEDKEIKAGMVFTIEPGIYLPGKFGVRIEDMVSVTRKGCEVLSGTVDK